MMEEKVFSEVIVDFSKVMQGGTFDCFRESVTNFHAGYFVSLSGCSETVNNLDRVTVESYISKYKLDEESDLYLGIWRHEGRWTLDITGWHKNQLVAKIRGKANRQEAIWDCRNQKEIYLDYE